MDTNVLGFLSVSHAFHFFWLFFASCISSVGLFYFLSTDFELFFSCSFSDFPYPIVTLCLVTLLPPYYSDFVFLAHGYFLFLVFEQRCIKLWGVGWEKKCKYQPVFIMNPELEVQYRVYMKDLSIYCLMLLYCLEYFSCSPFRIELTLNSLF